MQRGRALGMRFQICGALLPGNILYHVYACSLPGILLFMAVWAAAWAILGQKIQRRRFWVLNLGMLAAAVAVILFATIFDRTPGSYGVVLRPLASLSAAREQREIYRALFMNLFFFFPLGLSLSALLPRRWGRGRRMAVTALGAMMLSAAVEYGQYRFSLGIAETDDVICNTLGALLGTAPLLIEKYEERRKRPVMTLTAVEEQFLRLLRGAIAGEKVSLAQADWPGIFALAAEQKLLPACYACVYDGPEAAENAALFASARGKALLQAARQARREEEFARLYGKLRQAGLHPVVVKGRMCARLYPRAEYRISGDDDIFLPEEEMERCHRVLLENGLVTTLSDSGRIRADEVTYTGGDGVLRIEVHRRLFDASGDAYDELNHFFVGVEAVETDGFLSLPPHEHLLYLILHAYKHFVGGGVGLRQMCDIGLWARAHQAEVDWPRLHRECGEVHAAGFAGAVFSIARNHLKIEFDPGAVWNCRVDVEPLLCDALRGGVYGTRDHTRQHSAGVTINAVKASRKGREAGLLRTVFPSRADLVGRYPYLERRPWLLPAAWAQRLWRYGREPRSGGENSAAGSVKLARERIALMELYGIMGERGAPR